MQRKGVGDFVTSVDVACERTLRAALRTLLPEAGFLGEETAAAELDRHVAHLALLAFGLMRLLRRRPSTTD